MRVYFYHPAPAQLSRRCRRFHPERSEDFARVRQTLPIPALLAWAGYPRRPNQPCFAHLGKTGTAFSVYRHYRGFWYFHCRNPECGLQGDVSELWFQIIRCSGLAPEGWSLPRAAGDLLARLEAGEIDTSLSELLGGAGDPPSHQSQSEDPHFRQLKALIKERKDLRHREAVTLPPPVRGLRVREVITGLFPEDGYLLLTTKVDWHEIARRDHWLAHYKKVKPPVPERSFLSSNYLLRADLKSSYAAYDRAKRRWLVIEGDQGSLEEQYWIHRQLDRQHGNLGCLCWSGGRSLHGWYWVEGWSEEEKFALYAQAIALGINDCNTWKICSPVRLPNGWNRKTGEKQKVLLWRCG